MQERKRERSRSLGLGFWAKAKISLDSVATRVELFAMDSMRATKKTARDQHAYFYMMGEGQKLPIFIRIFVANGCFLINGSLLLVDLSVYEF